MSIVVYEFIPLLLFSLGFAIPVGMIYWIRGRSGKRNPLTAHLLRAPGESISKQLEDINDDYFNRMVFCGIAPLFFYSSYVSIALYGQHKISPWLFIVSGVGMVGYFLFKIYRLFHQRRNLYLGLDCERAIGQELNQLMLDGYRVFHDFPAEGFNIDHVVFGENGIFAVETKGRAKPDRNRGQEDARVVYDGSKLIFPNTVETEPLAQAERQAEWLRKWLASAVGEQVEVRPILMLPGWFLDRKSPKMLIHNGKYSREFFRKIRSVTPIRPDLLQRITHQVEQRCRDVEPESYRKQKK